MKYGMLLNEALDLISDLSEPEISFPVMDSDMADVLCEEELAKYFRDDSVFDCEDAPTGDLPADVITEFFASEAPEVQQPKRDRSYLRMMHRKHRRRKAVKASYPTAAERLCMDPRKGVTAVGPSLAHFKRVANRKVRRADCDISCGNKYRRICEVKHNGSY